MGQKNTRSWFFKTGSEHTDSTIKDASCAHRNSLCRDFSFCLSLRCVNTAFFPPLAAVAPLTTDVTHFIRCENEMSMGDKAGQQILPHQGKPNYGIHFARELCVRPSRCKRGSNILPPLAPYRLVALKR